MFTIICTLPGSYFEGQTEEVESETDYSYERVVSVYGHPGLVVYPKNVWTKTSDIPVIDVKQLEKYPGNETH